MQEIEIKLQIPVQFKQRLINDIQQQIAKNIHLHAKYFDTTQSELAQRHMAIRMRKENDIWMQTFKAADSHMQRYELDLPRGNNATLDLSLYQHYPNVLARLKDIDLTTLNLEFETIIDRTILDLTFNDSQIEFCLDQGCIKTQKQQQAICEVEFELKQGQVQDLISVVKQWVKKYHLWIDVRSKAERGHLLSQQKTVSPARTNTQDALQALLTFTSAIAGQVAEQAHLKHAKDAACILHAKHPIALLNTFIQIDQPIELVQSPEFNLMLLDLLGHH
ncbi:CYTH domain-containing protein [Acinetobacter sp. HY1485]|uniref:CYTH domain-containing protein n=1 Tax=Acinetobacter sp. HY1485 TaxID=2970918 RepID=UPI0022B9501D|nr:CYTH domain-containing protein [Acinetobacter sp. HY1485]